MSYAQLRKLIDTSLAATGMPDKERKEYGGHRFRIGAAQALALAGRPIEYVMALGRWRCVESVLTYVETPTAMRVTDIGDMMTASFDGEDARGATAGVFRGTEVSATSMQANPRIRSH